MKKSSIQAFILVVIAFLIIGGLITIENNEERKFVLSQDDISNINNKDIEKLSLNIFYKDGNVYIEYYLKDKQVQLAKYYDGSKEVDLQGLEAFKFINRKLLSLNFKLPESVLVDLILNDLGLDSDFTKFNLKVQYINGDTVDLNILEY